MRRFFVPAENIKDKITLQDKGEMHHLRDVLRMKVGDEVIIFDGKGNEYVSRIDSLSSQQAVLTAIHSKGRSKNTLEVVLACALPKRGRFDYLVEKATELGVNRIIPLKTVFTVVDLKEDREKKKIVHWQQIAINASKQSKRSTVPIIEKVFDFTQAIQESRKYDLRLIPCLSGKRIRFEDALFGFKGKSIMVFIGPEGDFSEAEVSLAKKSGCLLVSLGKLVLKVDSAAIYTLAAINFALK